MSALSIQTDFTAVAAEPSGAAAAESVTNL